MAAIQCRQCGQRFEADYGYCPECGAIWGTPQAEALADEVPAEISLSPDALVQAVLDLQAQNRHLTERLTLVETQLAKMQSVSFPLQPKLASSPLSAHQTPRMTFSKPPASPPENLAPPGSVAEAAFIAPDQQPKEELATTPEHQEKPSVKASDTPTESAAQKIKYLSEDGAIWVMENVQPMMQDVPVSPAPELIQGMMPQPIETHARGQTATTREAVNMEENIGLKWFSRIGIVMLVLGVGLLIQQAITNQVIGYGTQIVLGILLGLGMIAGGHRISALEKYVHWGRTLIGGGFSLTYFLVYAAHHFETYQRATGMPQWLDVILLTLIVLGAIGMSLWHDSRVIASGAFFLGYTTAFLSSHYDLPTLFYALMLSVGVVVLAIRRHWLDMGMASLVISYGFIFLCLKMNPQLPITSALILLSTMILYSYLTLKSRITDFQKREGLVFMNLGLAFLEGFILIDGSMYQLFYSAGFWLIYMAPVLLFKPSEEDAIAVASVPGLLWHAAGTFLLVAYAWPWQPVGLAALVGTIVYTFTFFKLRSRLEPLATLMLYIATGYLSLGVLLLVNPQLITLAWIIESMLLVIISYKYKIQALRHAHYALDGIITGKFILYDLLLAFRQGESLMPLQGIVALAAILSFYGIGFYLKKHQPELLEPREKYVPALYVGVGTVGLLILQTFYLHNEALSLGWLAVSLAFLGLYHRWSTFVTLLEFFYAISALVIGKIWLLDVVAVSRKTEFLAIGPIVFYGITVGIFYGLAWHQSQQIPTKITTIGNAIYTCHSTALLLWLSAQLLDGVPLTACWLLMAVLATHQFWLKLESTLVRGHLYVFAVLLFIKALMFDGYMATETSSLRPLVTLGILVWLYLLAWKLEKMSALSPKVLHPDEALLSHFIAGLGTMLLLCSIPLELNAFWISIGWGCAGFVLVLVGFNVNFKTLRLHGLGVLCLTMAKVFFWDFFYMDSLSRTISLIALGLLSMGGSFFYSRYRDKIRQLIE